MSNEPIDPMKEAMKQYFRDNPHKAAEVHVNAIKLFAAIVVFSLIVGGLMKIFLGH